MEPIVTPAEMRQIDNDAPESIEVLIERAGAVLARSAVDLLGGTYGRRVAVIAGKGNNGKDGIDAARRLRRRGVGTVIYAAEELPEDISGVDLIIDAAYGTGFRGSFDAPSSNALVLAVDIPSGIDGLTGERGGRVMKADRTVTFGALKPGLLLGDGPELAGEIEIADIGLDVSAARAARITAQDARDWLPRKSVEAHKWQSGVRVVAGSAGMSGAASLACTAALKLGAGIVVASSIGSEPVQLPIEAVARELPEQGWVDQLLIDLARFNSLLIGPGLGTSNAPQVAALLDQAALPVVVDADALPALRDCKCLGDKHILATPHEGEFRALIGEGISSDRFASLRAGVEKLNIAVLLKGPTTLVCERGGFIYAIDSGDQRLATAGTGDVLAGCIAALMAQGLNPARAGALGAYLHGAALKYLPPRGIVASEVAEALASSMASLG